VHLSIVGSINNPDRRWNPLTVTASKQVRKVLLELARAPQERRQLSRTLADGGTTLDDLIRLQIVRGESDQVRLNFVFLTDEDRTQVADVARRHSRSLAHALADPQITAPLDAYPIPSVTKDRLAFIVLGCIALDWTALETLGKHGFLLFEPEKPGGNRYTLVGEERISPHPLRAVYWGSHWDFGGPYALLSFGDHDVRQRSALPDLLWRMSFEADRFPEQVSPPLVALHQHAISSLSRELATILVAVRDGSTTSPSLLQHTGMDPETLTQTLVLLERLQYLRRHDEQLELLVPVITQQDQPMVDAVVNKAMQTVNQWTKEHIDQIHSELSQIQPLHQGIDFPEVYTHVWHYLFGFTNRQLAAQGTIYDTYSGSVDFAGFLPAVYVRPLRRLAQTTRADIRVEDDTPEGRTREVSAAYQKAYSVLSGIFGTSPPLTVRIYRSRDRFLLDLHDVAGMPDEALAFFRTSGAPRPINAQLFADPDMSPVTLCREVAHAFVESATGDAFLGAKWIDEGFAEYFATTYCGHGTETPPIAPWIALQELDTEDEWHALQGRRRNQAYRQAGYAVKAMVDRFGEPRVVEVLRALKTLPLPRALSQTFGTTPRQLERWLQDCLRSLWRRRVAARDVSELVENLDELTDGKARLLRPSTTEPSPYR